MRTPFSFVGLALALLLVSAACHHEKPVVEKPPPTLAFYTVSAEPVAGGRFVDTPSLPKVGHVASAPDMVVTSLEAVIPAAIPPSPPGFDKNGDIHASSMTTPALLLKLHAPDLKKLANLVKDLKKQRVLVTLDGEPLMAPTADSLFRGSGVMYPVGESGDRMRVQDELEKMAK